MSSCSSTGDSYGSDEPPELEIDLAKLMDRASEALHARCTAARKLTRGASHEVFTLEFQETPDVTPPPSLVQAGFSCVARFSRVNGTRERSLSEIATIRYLRCFTSIPVPEIYYHDLNPDNGIGLPSFSWRGCPENTSTIAALIAQLSSLKFDQIGSLDENGVVGPLISPCFDPPKGPFRSTAEFMRAFLPSPTAEKTAKPQDPVHPLEQAGTAIEQFIAHNNQAYLQPPFCLIHADFDGQNVLFLNPPDGSGPTLSGVIDFEYAFTGPLYFLYEHPIFIQDVSWSAELYAENAVLRAHFVRAVYDALPDAETKSTFVACINDKSFALNGFRNAFMVMKCSERTLADLAKYYVRDLEDGTGKAYQGRIDYTPERYSETAEPLPLDGGSAETGTSESRANPGENLSVVGWLNEG